MAQTQALDPARINTSKLNGITSIANDGSNHGAESPDSLFSSSNGNASVRTSVTPLESDVSNSKLAATSQTFGKSSIDSQTVETDMHVDVLILGAGPTGIGAARTLMAASTPPTWLMLDAADGPGGMAITETDEHGFRWDLGGHVIHSHYPSFDEAISKHKDWVNPHRGAWVRAKQQWCPAPIQKNLGNLREGQTIVDELKARVRDPTIQHHLPDDGQQESLGTYFDETFGPALGEVFFRPFSSKQWAWPLDQLDHSWTSLRAGSKLANVPAPETTLVKRTAPTDTSTFPYPRLGTGSLWRTIIADIPKENQMYGETARVERVELKRRRVRLASGRSITYKNCINTLPLKAFIDMAQDADEDLTSTSNKLRNCSTTAVGFGFDGPVPDTLKDITWIFNADESDCFHRCTILSNFSKSLSAESDAPQRWNVMFETNTSVHRPVDTSLENLVKDHMAALRRWGAVTEDTEPLSIWHRRLHFGYPLPFIGRDEVLSKLFSRLEAEGVLSRGRFGAWRYESSNQDYAYVQGEEAVNRILHNAHESVYWPGRPDEVHLA